MGAEEGDVVGGAAGEGVNAGDVGDTEVAAEVADDLGGRAMGEVGVEIEGVDAFEEFAAEGAGFGRVGLAVDGLLDGADDLLALHRALGVGEGLGAGRRGRFGDVSGENDGAADGEGDAVEGLGAVGKGEVRGGCLEFLGEGGADVEEDGEGALVGGVV